MPHGRHDDGVRPIDAVIADPPAHGARERAECARSRALPHDRQEGSGNNGLDQHFHDSFGGTAALHAGEPRLAVGERAERLANDGRLRAGAAHPAGDLPVRCDERAVAAPRRGGTDDRDDGGQRVGLPLRRQPAGLDDDVGRFHSAATTVPGGPAPVPGTWTWPREPSHGL